MSEWGISWLEIETQWTEREYRMMVNALTDRFEERARACSSRRGVDGDGDGTKQAIKLSDYVRDKGWV